MLGVGTSTSGLPPADIVAHHLTHPPTVALNANFGSRLVQILEELANLLRVWVEFSHYTKGTDRYCKCA